MNDKDEGEMTRIYAATPRDEPSAAMDDAILAKARSVTPDRRAVHASSSHWTRLAGVAATLVIVASLAVLMQNEQPDVAVVAPASRDSTVAPVAIVQSEALQPAATAPSSMGPAREESRTRERTDRPDRNAGPDQSVRQPAPPQASLPRSDSMNAAAVAPEPRAFPAAPVPASSPANAQPALQSPGAAAAGIAARQFSGDPEERSRSPSAESTTRNPAAAVTATSTESPEAWLARIESLRMQGRLKEADDSLADFRKRYPDYPIPSVRDESGHSNR